MVIWAFLFRQVIFMCAWIFEISVRENSFFSMHWHNNTRVLWTGHGEGPPGILQFDLKAVPTDQLRQLCCLQKLNPAFSHQCAECMCEWLQLLLSRCPACHQYTYGTFANWNLEANYNSAWNMEPMPKWGASKIYLSALLWSTGWQGEVKSVKFCCSNSP